MIGAHLSAPAHAGTAPPQPARRPVMVAPEGQVQTGLNLYLPLKSPTQLPALAAAIEAVKEERVYPALQSLHYVHFARFLPNPDGSALWVVTTFDGPLESYIMDFVAVLGDVFTELLQFVADAPRLPVNRYPRDFVAYVKAHDVPTGVWSAYPDATVIDIQRATGVA